MGFHLGVHAGVHQHLPAVHRAPAGYLGVEGQLPDSLALVAGIAALLAVFGNPFFGQTSDRTSSRVGMRRPWMVIGLAGGSLGILVVALAPSITVVLVGWCLARR